MSSSQATGDGDPARGGLPAHVGMPDRNPLVVAHRGASEELAEHTLAAYRRAVEQGADALECDVRMTRDGTLVCVHDRRIDRTSDGFGVVSAKTLEDLSRNDFGAWRDSWDDFEDPPEYDEERRSVLTLDRLLELVVDTPRPLGLLIETKHPTRYAGWVEQAVVEALERYGLARLPRGDLSSPVRVMSFAEIALRRMRSLAPGVPTVFLMDRVPLRFRDGTRPYGALVAGPSVDVLKAHPRYVGRVHDQGGQVYVWTADRLADVDLCVRLGVDAVITNRPLAVLEHLGRA
ncbi:MAG: glycerophosphodiester phosphodiesterase family protein [Candidatus Nanopelagicales bacterium]